MSRGRRKKTPLDSEVNTASMLDVLHTGAQQAPKKPTKTLPVIQLPMAEPKTPDPSKPLDWFSAYERHAVKD